MKTQTKKNTVSKMQFVLNQLTAKRALTNPQIVSAYLRKFPKVKEQTAKNTVAWTASVGLKRAGLKRTKVAHSKSHSAN